MNGIEIIKKTHIKTYIFIVIGIIVGLLIQKSIFSINDSITNYYIISIIVLILGTFYLLPTIPLKEHKRVGTLLIKEDGFSVISNKGNETFDIKRASGIKIKLIGYDGQPWHENMLKLGHKHNMNRLRLVNGLGNYFTFNYKTEDYKFELYFDNKTEYTKFKHLIDKWTQVNSEIELRVLR